jgi:hypothetical protein
MFFPFITTGVFLAMPASTTYEIRDYGFGSGGSDVANSSTYSSIGLTGEVSSTQLGGTAYDLGPGLLYAQQTNTPAAPTLTNPSNYYNRLQIVLDTGSNPSDTTFAIAVSSDNFVTTNYLQADGTLGATAVYRTYTAWGGASGAAIIGLQPGTTYKAKVKAVQTKYTESGYSAEASASTSQSQLSFDIDISVTDSDTAAPYSVGLGTLAAGSVTTANEKVWLDLATNAEAGGFVYVYGSSAGLVSVAASHTITSATGDLSSVNEGFGLQVSTNVQTSGGPLAATSPYNGAGQTVGLVDTNSRELVNTSSAPIVGGRTSVAVKAKAASTTPTSSDYSTTMTLVASGTF